MKIIVSPTKSMKQKHFDLNKTEPLFKEQSNHIRKLLKSKRLEELKNLYKASDKVVETSYRYLHEEDTSYCALNLYDGLVFKQLKVQDYKKEELNYLEEHVIILSALYGALRVSDHIHKYRLDYFMNFDLDLYDFWKDDLTTYFASEDVILNLASSEFSNSVTHPNMVTVHFVNAEGKTLATAAKMARGDMLDYCVQEKVKNLEGVKKYNRLNYRFKEEQSDKHNLYFVMEEA